MTEFNQILREGKIVDNKRVKSINMKEVLKTIAQDSESFKTAVGYFYIEGLIEIIASLKNLKEIKILMGYETTKPTKEQLIKAFKENFNQLDENNLTTSAIKLFYKLVKEDEILKIRVYFGDEKKPERLHSKAYLFLRNKTTEDLLDRYKAGIIGSSNLTPSGLVGNTELNAIITEPSDLEVVELWFENLWENGTEDFEKLKVAEAITEAIEGSKFKNELANIFTFIEPKEFFKILIKYLNADYLFEEYKQSKLFQFQYVDFIRTLNNYFSKKYRGCFITSSVGLGKSYVASQIAKYFINNGKKVLIIAPAGIVKSEDQWPRYLQEFEILDKIELESMGMLQKNPVEFKLSKYQKNYGLIIIDEAHNFRNEDAFRTRNVKKIIDENGDAKILFLTATPINTSLDDLLNLVKLFHRKGQDLLFDKYVRELIDLVTKLSNTEYEELSNEEKEKISSIQEEIEKEMFVKSTRETIKTSAYYIEELKAFTGIDITTITDPSIKEVKYELDIKYKDMVNRIVDFITSLSAAHLRLLDSERGYRLGPFFKWILYKRFESDISSYYLTLKRLSIRNNKILLSVENEDINFLDEEDNEDDINLRFTMDFKEKLGDVINKIKQGKGSEYLKTLEELKHDIKLINEEISKIEPFLVKDSKILFKDDQKINKLNQELSGNTNKKILIFTEYKDTLKAIKEFLKDQFNSEEIQYIDSKTQNKHRIIEKFNDKNNKLRILISTDTLSEGYNISGADLVINFDIPYNPVRIIQRIGRATRLDNPKEIDVYNFRPDDSIDVELNLVDKMELRIKDIIRFVGIEYRIWFEAEKELLSERRKKDKKIYLEVLEKVRGNLRSGKFKNFETQISYTKPILVILQKAIKKYGITKEKLENIKIPLGNNYTLLEGKKATSMFYEEINSYNEEILLNKEIKEVSKQINFESRFREELIAFSDFKDKKKKEELSMQYYNDKIDKLVNNILDIISSKKLTEMDPEIQNLELVLNQIRVKCGSTTEKVLKMIKSEIQDGITRKEKTKQLMTKLEDSFRKFEVQKKLVDKEESLFAIGFIEE